MWKKIRTPQSVSWTACWEMMLFCRWTVLCREQSERWKWAVILLKSTAALCLLQGDDGVKREMPLRGRTHTRARAPHSVLTVQEMKIKWGVRVDNTHTHCCLLPRPFITPTSCRHSPHGFSSYTVIDPLRTWERLIVFRRTVHESFWMFYFRVYFHTSASFATNYMKAHTWATGCIIHHHLSSGHGHVHLRFSKTCFSFKCLTIIIM